MRNIGRTVQSSIYRNGVFGRRPVVPTDPDALAESARRRMTRTGWSYVTGGAGAQRTVDANREAFGRYRIVPRQMVDVGERSLATTLLGRDLPAPVLFAPVGALELAVQHQLGRGGRRAAPRNAEPALARAARDLGLPVAISTQASTPMEDTAATLGDSPRWFQLYWSSDDALVESFVRRAEASGCEAIVVTLDTHVLGWRTRDLDLGYLPFARAEGIAQYLSDPVFQQLVETRVRAASTVRSSRTTGTAADASPRPTVAAVRSLLSIARHHPGPTWRNLTQPYARAAVETFLEVFSRSTLTWSDLAWLRERTTLPVLVKGIQHPDDARAALDHGADGIIVSNHGGRQIDNAVASLDTLAPVVDAVRAHAGTGTRVPVLFDSGIRTGADVFTALALGADAALLGRPWVYGLALAGADGVRAVTEHVLAELDLTMALAGVSGTSQIGRHNLAL
ncbi:alpha-hydroxy-acid oxidizing protein [Promicromonospora iranensis]|uniref:L-lactate dehydrogenase (Cytochrome)/lactate 2-monooxygenase n=1 Tax=Promicromonospora iranensis TaxID=1105144 RepID=A0ABU2CHA6_9MICO|nr:alpha-hydroxy-acid oxidizing protein [Promicromonospora iranensis]MDR7380698.1 L-lactate dehydrogenase (cytochrome)/lactate 2-monooxygenase [Promicromonospora iranensis]